MTNSYEMTKQEQSDAVGRAHDLLYKLICDYGPGITQDHFNQCDEIFDKLRLRFGLQTNEQHNEDRRRRFESGESE